MNKPHNGAFVKWGVVLVILTLILTFSGIVSADTATVVKILPGQVSSDCKTVTTDVVIEGFPQGQVLTGVNIELDYDSTILKYNGVQTSTFFPGFIWMPANSSTAGKVIFSAGNFSGAVPATTNGTVMTVTFDIIANGDASVIPSQNKVNLTTTQGSDLPVTLMGDVINIDCVPEPASSVVKIVPGQVSSDCKTVSADLVIEEFPQGQVLTGVNIAVNYDSTILNYKGVQEGSFFPDFIWMPADTSTEGKVTFSAGNFSSSVPATTEGTVLTLNFDILKNGVANVSPDLANIKLTSSQGNDLPVTVVGDNINITCITVPEKPTVQTGDASGITMTEAVLNGSIDSNGGALITDYGFFWGTDPDNLTKQSVGSGEPSGAYSLNIDSLTPETKYYYQAYATNSFDTGTGEMKNFTTEQAPPAEVTVNLNYDENGVNNERPLTISGSINPGSDVSWQVEIKDNYGVVVQSVTPAAGPEFSGVVYQPDFNGLPVVAEYTVTVTATPASGTPIIRTESFHISNFNYFIDSVTVNGSGPARTVAATVSKSGASEPQAQAICQVTSADGKVVFLKINDAEEFAADSDKTIEFQLDELDAGTYNAQIFLWIKDTFGNWKVLSETQTASFTI
ncbi:MAG: cohesin domain-containing protein [Desulfotomaculaceae bacterium]|nr:cohesin domain-containing protein [Desulfotomaculaceae bacterium]